MGCVFDGCGSWAPHATNAKQMSNCLLDCRPIPTPQPEWICAVRCVTTDARVERSAKKLFLFQSGSVRKELRLLSELSSVSLEFPELRHELAAFCGVCSVQLTERFPCCGLPNRTGLSWNDRPCPIGEPVDRTASERPPDFLCVHSLPEADFLVTHTAEPEVLHL